MYILNEELTQRKKFTFFLMISIQIVNNLTSIPLYINFFCIYLSFVYFFSLIHEDSNIKKKEINSLSSVFLMILIWFGIPVGMSLLKNRDETLLFFINTFIYLFSILSLWEITKFLMKKYLNFNEIIFYQFKLFQIQISNLNIMAFFTSAPFVIIAYISQLWVFNNFLCLTIAFYFVRRYEFGNIYYLIYFAILCIICEVYLIYFSDVIFSSMIFIKAPWKWIIPVHLKSGSYSILCIFDLIIPIYFMKFAFKFDLKNKKDNKSLIVENKDLIYFNFVFTGFFVGALITYTIIMNTNSSQSALTYILSSMVLSFIFLAYQRREMNNLLAKIEIKEINEKDG